MGNYEPLHWLAMAVLYRLCGLSPVAVHLYGAAAHALAAAALCWVCRRILELGAPGEARAHPAALSLASAAGALSFSLHPLRVETVAWASGVHYAPAGLFYLLAAAVYLEPWPPSRRLFLSAAAFALSLLCLPAGMALPLGLLCLDLYPLRRWSLGAPSGEAREGLGACVREKAPHFALAALSALAIVASRARAGMLTSRAELGLLQRIALSCYAPAYYLSKTLAPLRLSPFLKIPPGLDPLAPRFIVSAAALAVLAALLWRWCRRAPAAAAAGLFYAVNVAPTLALFQGGHLLAADRYAYIPSFAWAALAAGAVFRLALRPSGGLLRGAALAASGAVLVALAAGSRAYCQIWRDSETFWSYAVGLDPRLAYARDEALGRLRGLQRRPEEAAAFYRRSLEENPRQPGTHANRGVALQEAGRFDEALSEYELALKADPSLKEAYNGRGSILAMRGRFAEAVESFQSAVRLDPAYAQARGNWGLALAEQGRREEARRQYEEGLRLDPGNADLLDKLRRLEEGPR